LAQGNELSRDVPGRLKGDLWENPVCWCAAQDGLLQLPPKRQFGLPQPTEFLVMSLGYSQGKLIRQRPQELGI
jgi:hypothetical protein